jgi:hypothetical protein
MADIAELEKRVAALEAGAKTDIPALKRDLRRVLSLQDDALEQLEELNRRVAVVELTVKGIDAKVDDLAAAMGREMGVMRQELGEVKADVAALRRDLPGMLVDAIRAARDA